MKRSETDSAVESFESALEQTKKLYPGQQHVAKALNRLAIALDKAGNLDASLGCSQEAKKILDDHSEEEYPTRTMLYNIGTTHVKRGEFLLAFQVYIEALDMNVSDRCKEGLYGNMASTMGLLYQANYSQIRMFTQSKEDKVFDSHGTVEITKDTCPALVNSFYQSSLLHRGLVKDDKERDEMLAYLVEAREIAERFDYKCGRVVLVLLLLSMKYGETGCFKKSRSYYEEAKEMAKSLPPGEDDSILPYELDMIEVLKR